MTTLIRQPASVLILAIGLSAILAFTIASPAWPSLVEGYGRNVPVHDIVGDYAVGVLWACGLGASILLWPIQRTDKIWLLGVWVVRCLVALLVMLPYEERYPGLDCWVYFRDAHMEIWDIPMKLFSGGADFVVGVGAIHLTIGPDSYHAMKLTFTMIGLVALYLFCRSAEILLPGRGKWALAAVCLYPSISFWSSILGKDPVVLLGIALHVWGLVNVTILHRRKHVITVLLGIAVASIVRIWMGPILLLPAFALLTLRMRSIGWRLATLALAGLAFAILVPATVDRLNLAQASDVLDASQAFSRDWRANSSLDIRFNSVLDLVTFLPESIFIAYFRPLPGDLNHMFGYVAGVENAVLLGATVWAILRLRRQSWSSPLFLWAMLLLLTWGGAYGLVAYKDLGTAVRFKLQILPVLLGVIGYLLLPASRKRIA